MRRCIPLFRLANLPQQKVWLEFGQGQGRISGRSFLFFILKPAHFNASNVYCASAQKASRATMRGLKNEISAGQLSRSKMLAGRKSL